MHQRKVQGFCGKTVKILALEQRIIALKALACKGFRVVQYTVYMGAVVGMSANAGGRLPPLRRVM